MQNRRPAKPIRVKNLILGGHAPIAVQSMCNTDPEDYDACLKQIRALENAGCDLVRLTVPTPGAAKVLGKLKDAVDLPLVADIHFDYKMALAAIDAGADKIRINPGNLGGRERLRAVADAARKKQIPIRVGINGGSLEAPLLSKYGHPCPEALCESAMNAVHALEACDFDQIVVSVKSSSVPMSIAANRLIAKSCDYPIHLGVTEAGAYERGVLKNAIGIGALLCDGIGDTIRVSLTADPVQEVYAARSILAACERQSGGVEVVSCPTCGRTKIDLLAIVEELEQALKARSFHFSRTVKVAVMGCAVNGPGEAKEADLGVAGGIGEALLFAKGEIMEKIPQEEIVPRLLSELQKLEEAQR